jgi:hypothetical protein
MPRFRMTLRTPHRSLEILKRRNKIQVLRSRIIQLVHYGTPISPNVTNRLIVRRPKKFTTASEGRYKQAGLNLLSILRKIQIVSLDWMRCEWRSSNKTYGTGIVTSDCMYCVYIITR